MKPSRYVAGLPARVSEESKHERPTYCGVLGCDTRYVGEGKPKQRGYADVVFTLESGVTIARCAEHYMRQLYRTGKGSMSEITGRDWVLTPEAVKAHWERLEAKEKAA
jgi:hypothetical protein